MGGRSRLPRQCARLAWLGLGAGVAFVIATAYLVSGVGRRGHADGWLEESLVAAPSQLEALVESRQIATPPATSGNRFLSGWRAFARKDRRVVADPAGTRIEGVSLGDGPRRLVLELAADPPLGSAPSVVRVAGGSARSIALGRRTMIDLPAGRALGRFAIELALPPGTPALRAGFDHARAAGIVRISRAGLSQGGASLVELVRPFAGEGIVSGVVRPPAAVRDGQRLELRQRCEGRDRVLWRWQPRWQDALRSPRFEVAVRCPSGWLRLRLLAPEPGPPAVWRHLTLSTPKRPVAPPPLAAARAARRPRVVLLYVFDALRADHVGSAAAARRDEGDSATPTLDTLARAGAFFEGHRAVAPNTLPSTKALLTGHIWRQQGGVPLGPDLPTLAEAFRGAGYRTGLFSGSVYVSPAFGVSRGFEIAPQDAMLGEAAPGRRNENAARVNEAALAWVRSLPPKSPVFLYLHVIHPHNPYDPPAPHSDRVAVEGSSIDGSTRTLLDVAHLRRPTTEADRRRIAALYRANLAYADAQLGVLVAALAERYGERELLVVATSDHGEELFDHGGLLHGYTLYEEQLRIPLVLHWPGTISPQRISRATSTVDLHQALLGLARANGRAVPFPPLLGGTEENLHLAAASSVRGGIFAARTRRWKVVWAPRTGIHWGVGEGLGRGRDAEQVFDLVRDPEETRNLAGLVDAAEPLWLRGRLLAWARQAESSTATPTQPSDAETRARLHALGYADGH